MNAIAELERAYIHCRFGLSDASSCIQWGVARLQANEEESDLDVVLLAGVKDGSEALPLAERILQRYLGPRALDEQRVCGKYVSELHRRYEAGKITISEIDTVLSELYPKLSHPSWLVMLCRNCEYATDVEGFVKHFEDEFHYIAHLWDDASSTEEFLSRYDRNVSNSHDIPKS